MMRRLFAFVMVCVWLLSPAQGGRAEQADDGEAGAVWTAVIPDAFPNSIYTWRMKGDGSYREDGHDATSGRPIQSTLSGRWTREGPHMVLRQDDMPYVFDGVVIGNLYAGTLYFGGHARSRFCAARGEVSPDPGRFSTCSTATTSAGGTAPGQIVAKMRDEVRRRPGRESLTRALPANG
jgi:hypothetical protein